MEMQSDVERKAAAFDALVAKLLTLGPRGAWPDNPDEARAAAAQLLDAIMDALRAGGADYEAQMPVHELLFETLDGAMTEQGFTER